MCLWRKMACAPFIVPGFCRSVPKVRRNTWKVQRFRSIPSLSAVGHTFHLKKFLARNGTAFPLFCRCPCAGNIKASGDVSGQTFPSFDIGSNSLRNWDTSATVFSFDLGPRTAHLHTPCRRRSSGQQSMTSRYAQNSHWSEARRNSPSPKAHGPLGEGCFQ